MLRFILLLPLWGLIQFIMSHDQFLYNFTSASRKAWEVEDDKVMGGESEGHFEVTQEGHGKFYGHVSLANDGGFSSIQRELDPAGDVSQDSAFTLRVKGDGKNYTLRAQTETEEEYMFEGTFSTSGDWEEVRVPFSGMKAMHHGEPVDVPPFTGGPVYKLQLTIGNEKEQDFEILIDWIGSEG